MKTTISVVIPVFNGARFIANALGSLLSQTHAPNEVIVINDASTDKTSQIVEQFVSTEARIKFFNFEKNKGASYARWFGAGKAKGDIIAFLDSDCTAPANWIELILKEFEEDPSLGGVGGGYSHPPVKKGASLMAKLEEEYVHTLFLKTPFESNPPGGNSAFRKDAWIKNRSLHEIYLFRGINSGEDDFVCDEIRKDSRIKFSDKLHVFHHPLPLSGYLKRHVNRGKSWGFRFSKKMTGANQANLTAYGGYRLFFGSLFLGLSLLSLFVAPYAPLALLPFPLFLVLFFLLSRKFLRFMRETDRQIPDKDKTSWRNKFKIFFLLFMRSAAWVLGASLFFSRKFFLGIQKKKNILFSILHFWRPARISKLFYFVTSVCNARCEFCFNLENVENGKERKPHELSLKEIRSIAEKLKRLPYLNLSGGEPFMRKDLADLIEVFHRNCKTQWVTIPTNASLTKTILDTTQEILTRCPILFLTVQISIDGLDETHDHSRKIKGGFTAMTKTLEGLSRLKPWYPNLRIQIATAYDDFNASEMPEIIRFVREHFIYDQQMFYLIREAGLKITPSRNHLIPSFSRTLAENENYEGAKIRQTLWSQAVRILQEATYSDVVRIKQKKEFLRPCHALRKFVTLYDDGQISPCEILDSVNLGNIRDFDYDYYKLMRKKESVNFYKQKIVKEKCNCDWMCAVPINMLYDIKMAPRLIRALTKPVRLFYGYLQIHKQS